MLSESVSVALLVTDALDALGIPYAIGGSLSSAIHGVTRATMDADLVADLRLEHVEPLARELSAAFYADPHMMRDAVRRHSSFNVIHLETAFKVDVFVAKPRPFDRSQLARRQIHLLSARRFGLHRTCRTADRQEGTDRPARSAPIRPRLPA